MRSQHLILLSMLLTLLASGCAAPKARVTAPKLTSETSFGDVFALWVTRWDFRTEDDVKTIVNNAADLGITDLVFQVRGQADAFYESQYEPWGEELLERLGPGADDPDFDPLEVACDTAHDRNMRLHAWINVMPLWRGKTPPRNQKHLYHVRKDFRLFGRTGEPQPLNDHYVIVNPIHAQVHDHITNVVRDIVSNYPVDGIHMDYIRFVSESMDEEAGYPYGAGAHRLFKEATGLDALSEPAAYRTWIMSRITDLVAEIRATINSARPGTALTAAVWPDYNVGRERYLQDYPAWIDRGLIDAAMPMIYTTDDARFERQSRDAIAIRDGAALLPGVGVYRHDDPDQSIRQFDTARRLGANGLCIFSYHALFDSHIAGQESSPEARTLREQRRKAVREYIAQVQQ